MNQQPIPRVPAPTVVVGEPDDSAQWRASRAFGAFACFGLLIALWLPWFKVSAFLVGTNQQLTAKGGFAPVSVTAWDISSSLAFVIAIAALLALYVAITGPLDYDGRWAEWAIGAYWLSAVVALLAVCAIALGIVSLPSSITSKCTAQAALATAQTATESVCATGRAEIRSKLLFGGGISIALGLMLVGSAAWGMIQQPRGSSP